jgi:hypothetical protein
MHTHTRIPKHTNSRSLSLSLSSLCHNPRCSGTHTHTTTTTMKMMTMMTPVLVDDDADDDDDGDLPQTLLQYRVYSYSWSISVLSFSLAYSNSVAPPKVSHHSCCFLFVCVFVLFYFSAALYAHPIRFTHFRIPPVRPSPSLPLPPPRCSSSRFSCPRHITSYSSGTDPL